MSGKYGADVEQLRQLAAAFQRTSNELSAHRTQLGGRLRSASWLGPDGSGFIAAWDSEYGPRISAAAALLQAGSDALMRNAADQESASGGATGSPGLVHDAGGSVESMLDQLRNDPDPGMTPGRFRNEDGSYTSIIDEYGRYGSRYFYDNIGGGDLELREFGNAGPLGSVDGDARDGSLGADGSLGVMAGGGGTYRNGDFTADGEVESFVGVKGDAGADIRADAGAISGSIGGSGFLGAQLTGHGGVGVAGVNADVNGTFSAGLGVTARAEFKISYDEIRFEGELGYALGFGGKVKPSFTISPKALAETIAGWLP